MVIRSWGLLFVNFFVVVCVFVFNYGTYHCADIVEVTILGINDFHGQLDHVGEKNGRKVGSAPYLASHLKKLGDRNPNTFLVHSGDIVGGSSPLSSLFKDEPTIKFLNQLNFSVGTPGNHEFDRGKEEMLRLISGGGQSSTREFSGAHFPYISANVVDRETQKHILPPYIIKEVEGVKIGFIGVTTRTTPSLVVGGNVDNVNFLDEAKSINTEARHLKEQGVNTIIVLAHEGGFQSETGEITGAIADIIQRLDTKVDAVFTGHNNQHINGMMKETLVMQAEQYGTAIANVKLEINKDTGEVVSKSGNVHYVYHDEVVPCPITEKFVQSCQEDVGPVLTKPIGSCARPLDKERNEYTASSLGSLIADAIRYKMKTDIAFMNTGGIRGSLPAGVITWGALYSCEPFSNQLVKVDMTGEKIRQVLNQQYQNDNKYYYLDPSGVTFQYDPRRRKGDQVVGVKTLDGESLLPEKIYSVAINEFLATGGVGFTLFKEGANREVGSCDLDALIEYVSQLSSPVSVDINYDRVRLVA